ncbi:uncharacterized mitochondrial protein-like protein [Tanacetum coccineum]
MGFPLLFRQLKLLKFGKFTHLVLVFLFSLSSTNGYVYFTLIKNVDNGEPKTTNDAQKQDEDGLINENAEQERFLDDSSSKDVNAVGQQVNTASPDVNTGSLELNVVEAMQEELLGKIDQTLLFKKQKGDILLIQVYVDDIIFGSTNKKLCTGFEKLMKDKFQMISMGELTFFLGLQVQQKEDGIFINQDKYVAKILKKFNYSDVKFASTPVDLEKPLVKDGDADDVDDYHVFSFACARFQVTPKTSHLLAVKRIFRYLKGKPTLGLWYSRDSPFELVAYTDSDYAGATLDRKSTTGGLIMSSATSAVTYTSVYTDSEPGRAFWGADDEEISEGGIPRVIVLGYDRLPMQPVSPPSPDYIPGDSPKPTP